MDKDNMEKKRKPHFITIIVCCIFALFLIALIFLLIWSNVKIRPIHIGQAEQVESITISYSCRNGEYNAYDLYITGEEALREFIKTAENLKGKNIVNGGSGDYDTKIYIRVAYNADYSGEKLGYCCIYGPQILLSEGGGIGYSYQMSEKDYEEFLNYVLALNDSAGFPSHPALTQTVTVGGLMAYNIISDEIIEIPEEYFAGLDGMSYEEIVAKIGNPSGEVGSGIVRSYWRIGEDKYAVWWYGFEIWSGE